MNLLADPELFGRIAAEEERHEIENYFQETHVFQNVYRGQKYLVLGRKGSGKSALFFYLQKRLQRDGTHVTLMTLNNYPQARFAELRTAAVDITEAHVQTWKFTLLLTFMSLYLDASKPLHSNDPNRSKYRKFYNENSLSRIVSSPWEKICDFLRSVENINVSALGIGGGITRKLDLVTRNEFGLYANQINARLQTMLSESLSRFMPQGHLTILIDRLDEQWRNEEQSNALLVGLLKACREINRELPGCRAVVFLRSDIFSRLRYQNRAHITEFIQEIRWRPDDLERVIARRIAARLGSTDTTAPDFVHRMWSLVFQDMETILYHASKGKGQKLQKFFETNSFLRPRDYIQLAKCLQDVANQHGQQKITPKIGSTLVDRIAEEQYSKRVYTEFQDELMDVMPNFSDVMEVLRRDLKYYRFTLDEFCDCLGKNAIAGNPIDVLHTLFEYSVVGIDNMGGTRHEGGPGGRGDEYAYQSDLARFDGTETFKFHPSLRLHLHLRARSRNTPRTAQTLQADATKDIHPVVPAKATPQRRHRNERDEQRGQTLWDDLN